mmetsp:Transcript_24778/g.49290  ORF Transcript_24778/g.49290 Transcript_24778/m.49290 type:complete len:88 (+) Transcript_24778:183-446(+)
MVGPVLLIPQQEDPPVPGEGSASETDPGELTGFAPADQEMEFMSVELETENFSSFPLVMQHLKHYPSVRLTPPRNKKKFVSFCGRWK